MSFIAPRNTAITVSASPSPPLAELEALWRDLERRADGSFFTSWTWIGPWLSTFREDGKLPDLRLLIARAGQLIVGAALMGSCGPRSILSMRPAFALHQSGVPEDDAIYIEYNDFLLDRSFAAPAREALFAFIATHTSRWGAFRLSGVTPAVRDAVTAQGLAYRTDYDRLCPWVNLSKVPPGLSGYFGVLSRNSRQQIQRSLRLYESEGTVEISAARDTNDAQVMLDELRQLHMAGWRERKGHEGAFGSARFERFVRALVCAGVPTGTVQLLRVHSAGKPIGLLLNFVHHGHIYAYQSGFAYRDDNRIRPGLLTHALAVVRAREQGLRGYHFMAGDGRYKSSLANADEHLFWMTLRRGGLFARGEDVIRAAKSRIRAALTNFSA